MERSTLLNIYQIEGKLYTHRLFLTDDRAEIRDEDGILILRFAADCYVYDIDGKLVGRMRMKDGKWGFLLAPEFEPMNVGSNDIFDAERIVFIKFITGMLK